MPANYEDYVGIFEDLVGTTGPSIAYNDKEVAGVFDWIDIYETSGVGSQLDEDDDREAFSEFLLAFFPQDKSPEEWWYDREEYYDNWDTSAELIDWDAYRDAIGYGINE